MNTNKTRWGKGKIVIGITGSIGAGKTTVLNFLAKNGVITISSDDIANSLIEVDDEVRNGIKNIFGEGVFDKEGGIDKKKIADIIFKDDAKRMALETLMHPKVVKLIEENIKRAPKDSIIAVEVPLLFEKKLTRLFDRTLLIRCPFETRQERCCQATGMSKYEFALRDSVQWGEARKAELATYFINNASDLAHTEAQVRLFVTLLREEQT